MADTTQFERPEGAGKTTVQPSIRREARPSGRLDRAGGAGEDVEAQQPAKAPKAEHRASGAGALAAAAGALALFGGVGIWGVSFSVLELPLSIEKLADALLQLARGVESALPFRVTQLEGMVEFLNRLSSGDLAAYVLMVVAAHAVLTIAAIACGLAGARRRSAGASLVGALFAAADGAALWVACAYANQELYLALHSLARGNPWAVGRGVAGLPAELAPTMGVTAALVLAALAIVIAIAALVGRHRR